MQHHIPIDRLPPEGRAMARAVETCVHCGFCLPACPSYRVLGEEMDSPRGRIVLMKQALEGELSIPDVLPYIDRCLGCLGCVTACPSGVRYGELLTPFRAMAESQARSRGARLRQRALLRVLESPRLFRAAVRAGHAAQRMQSLVPATLRPMLGLLPRSLPASGALPAFVPATGARRARVALLAGCVQQVLAPDINRATLRVLSANGIETIVPRGQGCCGALAEHAGHAGHARARAERLLRAFPDDVDAIVTNAAGCGSATKEYAGLFEGTPLEARAHRFASLVRDVSEVLDGLGLVTAYRVSAPLTVAYHDACHLAHAQGVRAAPRRLLKQVAGVTVREVPDGEICCGSAGLYNLEHPDVAAALGGAKARSVMETGAEAVVTGNVGCLVQLSSHLAHAGHPIPVMHTVQLLDNAQQPAPDRPLVSLRQANPGT
jgi:glycolate oxidase iron-sulfur subunit